MAQLDNIPPELRDFVIQRAEAARKRRQWPGMDNIIQLEAVLHCIRQEWFERFDPLPLRPAGAWRRFRNALVIERIAQAFPMGESLAIRKLEGDVYLAARADASDDNGCPVIIRPASNRHYLHGKPYEHDWARACFLAAHTPGAEHATILYLDLGDFQPFVMGEEDIQRFQDQALEVNEREAKVFYLNARNHRPPEIPDGCGLGIYREAIGPAPERWKCASCRYAGRCYGDVVSPMSEVGDVKAFVDEMLDNGYFHPGDDHAFYRKFTKSKWHEKDEAALMGWLIYKGYLLDA